MKKRLIRIILFLFFGLSCIQTTMAQIINIEEKEAELLDTVAWFGGLQQDLRLVKTLLQFLFSEQH